MVCRLSIVELPSWIIHQQLLPTIYDFLLGSLLLPTSRTYINNKRTMGAGASIPPEQHFSQLPEIPSTCKNMDKNKQHSTLDNNNNNNNNHLQVKLNLSLPTTNFAPLPIRSTSTTTSLPSSPQRKWYTKINPECLKLIDSLPSTYNTKIDDSTEKEQTELLIEKIYLQIAPREDKKHWLLNTDIPKIRNLESSTIKLETPRDHQHSIRPELTLKSLTTYFQILDSKKTEPSNRRAILKKVISILSNEENIDNESQAQFCRNTRIREIAFAGHQVGLIESIEYHRHSTDQKIQGLVDLLEDRKLDVLGKRAILKQILRDTKGKHLSSPVKTEIALNGLKSLLHSPPTSVLNNKKILVPGYDICILLNLLQGDQTDLSPVEERAVLKKIFLSIHGSKDPKEFCTFIVSSSIYLIFRSAVRAGLLLYDIEHRHYKIDLKILQSLHAMDINIKV